jgi:hypothetical protein
VYLRTEHVFILERFFASKSFAAVREAFSSVYPDKEVPNKTTVQRRVTAIRDSGSVCLCQVVVGRQNSRIYGRSDFEQFIS